MRVELVRILKEHLFHSFGLVLPPVFLRLAIRLVLGFGLQRCFIISAEAFYFSGGEVKAVQLVEDMGDMSGEPAVGVEAAQVFKSGGRKIIHCNSFHFSSIMHKAIRIKLAHIHIIDINL